MTLMLAAFPTTVQAQAFDIGGGDNVVPCEQGAPRTLVPESDLTAAIIHGNISAPGMLECDPPDAAGEATRMGEHILGQAGATMAAIETFIMQTIAPIVQLAEPGPCGSTPCLPPLPCDAGCLEPVLALVEPRPCDGLSVATLCVKPSGFPCVDPATACPIGGAPPIPCQDLDCGPDQIPCVHSSCPGIPCVSSPMPCEILCVTSACPDPTVEPVACDDGTTNAVFRCLDLPGCVSILCSPPDTTCLGPGVCVAYTPEGNLICSTVERLIGADTDGDRTKDCEDPDDDNDGLSDEVEDTYFPAPGARVKRDHDFDGIGDGHDMLGDRAGEGIRLLVSLARYDAVGLECDVTGRPDPYLRSWALSQLPIGATLLSIPAKWSLNDHQDDRSDDEIMAGNALPVTVSADIRDWQIDLWQLPFVDITAILYDHDDGTPDEQIDLSTTPGIGAGLGSQKLTADPKNGKLPIIQMEGDAACAARFTITIEDNVDDKRIRMVVANMALVEPVRVADVESDRFW